jgi:hypothetical protein
MFIKLFTIEVISQITLSCDYVETNLKNIISNDDLIGFFPNPSFIEKKQITFF